MQKILDRFPSLKEDDVTSRSMGANGEDVLLSPKAQKYFPFSCECKHHAKFSIYKIMEQAEGQETDKMPLAFIKGNHKEPLVVLKADDFFKVLKDGIK